MRRKTKVQKSAHKSKPRSRAKARRPQQKPLKQLLGVAGNAMFGPVGRAVADTAYDVFSHITGRGEYKITKNSIMDSTGPPRFNNGDGTVVIEHVEFVKDVYSSVEFKNDVFRINPGNHHLFPWLSNISHGWTTYEPLGIVVTFESLANSVATSPGTGVVSIATNYDVTAPPYASMREGLNSMFSTSGKPQVNMIHPIECARSTSFSGQLLIYNSEEPERELEPLLTDLGNLQIMTEGMPTAGEIIGQIRLSYKIKMTKPQPMPLMTVSEYHALGGAVTTAYPFGTTLYPYSTNTLDVSVSNNGYVYFPKTTWGTFILEVIYDFPGNYNVDSPAVTFSPAVTPVPYYFGTRAQVQCNRTGTTLDDTAFLSVAFNVPEGHDGEQWTRFAANIPALTITSIIIVRRIPDIPALFTKEPVTTKSIEDWPGFSDKKCKEDGYVTLTNHKIPCLAAENSARTSQENQSAMTLNYGNPKSPYTQTHQNTH